jgi:hypothetical protein
MLRLGRRERAELRDDGDGKIGRRLAGQRS